MEQYRTEPKFGDYCKIEQKRFGCPNEMYTYKVIGALASNEWVDVPVREPATEVTHKGVEPVVRCICEGLQETTVLKFRVQDIELLPRGPVSAPSVLNGPWKIREIEHKCHPESGDLSVDIETVISDEVVSLSCRDVEDKKLQNLVNALNDCHTGFSFDSDSYAETRIENYRLSEELRKLQSEGVLQWVKPVDSETIPSFGIPVLAEMNYGVYQEIERRGHRSTGEWWILNVRRWLSPSTANTEEGAEPATREQQTAFAEWLHINRWFTFENGFWHYTFEQGTSVSDKVYNQRYRKTSAQLYKLFLTETKQQ